MCGICGIHISAGGASVDRWRVGAMTASLEHRGPDDEGAFVEGQIGLGHRRLSIIDLSAAGRQPMADDTGRYQIVLNGEIYNYRELRAGLVGRGHQLRSQTDTEVVLHLYQEEGPRCLERLNGMFAFAIWDALERTLFAARDRMGIKPFYFSQPGAAFVFGSEIKALFASGLVAPELDRNGLADYLTFQFTIGEKTLFRGVKKLLPGHYLFRRADGDITVKPYWDLNFDPELRVDEGQCAADLLELLEDAVRLQLRSDVPVGAHVSGGLDSSVVTRLAASAGLSSFHTFTGGFADGPRYDETGYARVVAENVGSLHHEVFPTIHDLVEWLPRLVFAMDEPAGGPGLFPQYAVDRLASEHVKVILTGHGGDEVFSGYTRYVVAYLEACLRGGIDGTYEDAPFVVTFESLLPNLAQLKGYEPMLQGFWREGLFESADRRYFRLIDRSTALRATVHHDLWMGDHGYSPFEEYRALFNHPECGSLINKMTRFDQKTLLPALLQVEDRVSMSVSLESRVPLLDHRIAEMLAALPPAVKFKGGRTKHLFRSAVAGLLPESIQHRRDKMGFPVPFGDWCRREPLCGFLHDVLHGKAASERGLYGSVDIEQLLNADGAYGRSVWGVLSLELWMQTFIDAGVRF